MRSYSITRSTMEWNRIRKPDIDGGKALNQLREDIAAMLAYDDSHVSQLVLSLPEGVEKSDG